MTVRTLIVTVALIALSACSSQLPPPSEPTATQIAQEDQDWRSCPDTPGACAQVGFTQVRRRCVAWFQSQVQGAQGANFLQSLLGMGAAGAAVAGSGPAAPAALGLLSAATGSAQSSFGAGANPVAVYVLVSHVLDAAVATMPVPATNAEAGAQVESLWEKCTLPYVAGAAAQAMMTVPVTATVPAPAPVVVPVLRDRPPATFRSRVKRNGKEPRIEARPSADDERLRLEQEMVYDHGRATVERHLIPSIKIGP